ncbi:MAG: hypothetical protein H0X62_07585 [Bacteroidetes bacterium]|nr:hypothetical protein [Bacteroidota bacterium]
MKKYLGILAVSLLFSCKQDSTLVVTVVLTDKDNVESLVLETPDCKEVISKDNFGKGKEVKLRCSYTRESTYNLCVYFRNDTICTFENYVSYGMRPKYEIEEGKLEVLKHV